MIETLICVCFKSKLKLMIDSSQFITYMESKVLGLQRWCSLHIDVPKTVFSDVDNKCWSAA